MNSENIFSDLINNGYKYIAGCDEVGRGCIAGPVVACSVIITQKNLVKIKGLNDSKKISPKKRAYLFDVIKEHAIDFSFGIIPNTEIDKINILNASIRAMEVSIDNLKIKPEHVLIDGNQRIDIDVPQTTIVKGDLLCPIISAASILAKVYRDNLMNELDAQYPNYELNLHKGYCTKKHLELVQKYGVSEIHRKTFRGVREHIGS